MKQFQQYNNWIICLDPESRLVYSTNADQIIIETKIHPAYQQKCEEALSDMDYILYNHENLGHWLQDSTEIEQYRRRQIPSYLLHPKQHQYKRYLSQSNMGFSISNIYTIRLNGHCQSADDDLKGKEFDQEFNLMTSANESILMILKHLNKYTEKQFILKVVGYEEYIFGAEPLLYFTRIRNIIRENKTLNVLLIDYNAHEVYDYPPIFSRPKGDFSQIEQWDQYLNVPIFMWYPKYKLKGEQIIRQNNIQNKPQLYSGQCDIQFSFKIIRIDQLKNLFEQDFEKCGKNRATYNGTNKLNNITKHQPSQSNKDKDIFMIKKNNIIIEEPHFTPHRYLSFGGVESRKYIQQLKTVFDLNFEPYLISIKVSLYYGDNLLTEVCQVESQMIPFCFSPSFNQYIKFPQIKYSMLPQEIRLCFDVIIYSFNGESQIIGSTCLYLFDQNSFIKQGLQILNLWPFYKTNPRLSCYSEFKGETNLDKNYLRCRPRCYSYLVIKMDSFSSNMKWSLRDLKTQQNLGTPKDCLSVKYYADQVRSDAELRSQIENQKHKHYQVEQTKQLDLDGMGSSIINLTKRKGISIIQNIDSQRTSGLSQLARNSLNNFIQQFKQYRITSNYYKENSDRLGLAFPYKDIDQTPKTEDLAYLQTLLSATSLDRMKYSQLDKFLLMICRHHYKTLPFALPLFLKAVNWSDPKQVREAHIMIKEWIPLPSQFALLLLDAHFADEIVRLYAIERISLLSDDELSLYLLQLSQALQFEKNIYNPLGELLLERGSANPFQIGQEIFWLLKSQLILKPSFIRYFLLIEQLLMICGQFRECIVKEVKLNQLLNESSLKIKSKTVGVEMQQKNEALKKELRYILQNISSPFTLPIDARMQISTFDIEQCKVLNSKKLPLQLYMKSHQSTHSLQVIFKNGDDLKQDMLTLQIIRIIDRIWLDAGLDFKMQPYKVIATDDQVGMIEVVLDSINISAIHENIGTFGAFDVKSILDHLQRHNPNLEDFNKAKDNFLRSCAGYCVATYVLGVGDRHSGNIMVKTSGHIFHIDFGHFLGNFKIKFGINRERAKFVLTPEMKMVMGGEQSNTFKQFEEHCVNAYNLIRKHGKWLVDLFLMNLSAGIPELQNAENVRYLQDRLALHLSEQEASMKFRQEIITSVNDNWRRFDNWIHALNRKG